MHVKGCDCSCRCLCNSAASQFPLHRMIWYLGKTKLRISMLTPLRKTSIIAPALKAWKSYFSFHSSGRIESKKKKTKKIAAFALDGAYGSYPFIFLKLTMITKSKCKQINKHKRLCICRIISVSVKISTFQLCNSSLAPADHSWP